MIARHVPGIVFCFKAMLFFRLISLYLAQPADEDHFYYQSGEHDPLDTSLHEYCGKKNTSILMLAERKTNAIICPSAATKLRHTLPGYLCLHDSWIPKSTPTKMLRFRNFLSFIKQHKFKLSYVGDSLALQMFLEVGCNLEAEGALPEHSDHEQYIIYQKACLLAPVSGWNLTRPSQTLALASLSWAKEAIRQNVTHIVLNTGAWWTYDRFLAPYYDPKNPRRSPNPNSAELVATFAAHFNEGSVLHKALSELVRVHGIRLIWRDIAPAGSCDSNHRANYWKYEYYKLFPVFNTIARNAILKAGGIVIPGTWDQALGHWRDHVYDNGVHMDTQHYCIFAKYTLPALWNSNLYKLLRSTTLEPTAPVG